MNNINFYSLARSGHHAIIFWMINNLGGFDESNADIYFINKKTGLYFYNNVTVHNQKLLHSEFSANWVIKNYEDTETEILNNNFIIIRDFLNLLCSRYKKWGKNLIWNKDKGISDIDNLIKVWKQHVQAPDKNYIISYNEWVKNKQYRDDVSLKLGVNNAVDNIAYVPVLGNGSSFLGLKKETDSSAYEKRFNQIKLPDQYIEKIQKDRELLDLNLKLFNIDISKILKNI